jgi:hypothetical protein
MSATLVIRPSNESRRVLAMIESVQLVNIYTATTQRPPAVTPHPEETCCGQAAVEEAREATLDQGLTPTSGNTQHMLDVLA